MHSCATRVVRAAAASRSLRPATRSAPTSLVRFFSSKSPRSRVALHPAQAARHRADAELYAKTAGEPLPNGEQRNKHEKHKADEGAVEPLNEEEQQLPRSAVAAARLISRSTSISALAPPTLTPDGRWEVRTKLHPDGAAVGRGRVVANFGTRMLVQELPWDDADSEGANESEAAAAGQSAQGEHHPSGAGGGGNSGSGGADPAPFVEGARFVCQPRGKLGKIVCGDLVLWEWGVGGSAPGDADAFVVEVLPRRSTLTRVDKLRGVHGEEVLLAANFDEILVVCAAEPATNATLLDRYVALGTRIGVPVSIVFNKIDMSDKAERFKHSLDDYRRIGVRVFETSCSPGYESSIEPLRRHLATLRNGRPGISIFVGQSGSGKSSLLNALSPSLQLAVNSLSRNAQGRHTTTQTILHALESGGEIIDSPGFQNFQPPAMDVREIEAGFAEIQALKPYCHYGSRCQHVHEPDCAVRMSLIADEQDVAEARERLRARREAENAAPSPILTTDQEKAALAMAYELAEAEGAGFLPDDPDSPLVDSRNRGPARHREQDLKRRERRGDVHEVAVRSAEIKLAAEEAEREGEAQAVAELVQTGTTSNADTNEVPPSSRSRRALAHLAERSITLARTLRKAGLDAHISKRRYESYRALVEQQLQINRAKFQ